MLMMRPQPRSTMPSHTCFVMLKHESRFVWTTASQLALSILRNVMSRVMPALFTSTSMGPRSPVTCFTHDAAESKLATSHGYARNACPCRFIDSSHSDAFVLPGECVVTTVYPSAASLRQIASPRPPMPPVTSALRAVAMFVLLLESCVVDWKRAVAVGGESVSARLRARRPS